MKKDSMIHYKNPYGTAAKRAYVQLIDSGINPDFILPKDLKHRGPSHTSSRNTFTRVKSKVPSIEGRSSFRNFLASFTTHNTTNLKKLNGFKLLDHFIPTIQKYVKEHTGIKFYFNARYEMHRMLNGKIIAKDKSWWKTSKIHSVNDPTGIVDAVKTSKNNLIEAIPEMQKKGSGWVFHKVLSVECHIAKYKAIKGGSYIKIPEAISLKKAVINVKNKDNECFKWSVLSALFPPTRDAERVSKYTEHEDKLDFTGISYPTPLTDLPKFERRNKISINVYGHSEKQGSYLLQKSKEHENAEKHIDLLLLHDLTTNNSHYAWIKNFSRFCGSKSNHNHGGKKYYCKYCIQGYGSQAKLDAHVENGCAEITTCKPCMPEDDKAFLEFKNTQNKFKAPFVIYADFECLTIPVAKCPKNSDNSYTDAYQQHEPCGFCIYVVGAGLKPGTFKPYVYRGPDAAEKFIMVLRDFEESIMKYIKTNEKMVMTEADNADFKNATCCSFCKKALVEGPDKVRDHDHMTGKYRGAAHSKCNIEEGKARTRNYSIPVFFHNLKNYDSHIIISSVGKHTSRLSVIPQNYEKFISFSYDHLKFLDSASFLAASVETLVSNLYDERRDTKDGKHLTKSDFESKYNKSGGKEWKEQKHTAVAHGKHKFQHTLHHCKRKKHVDMMMQKGIYPYDYMDDWKRFDEARLPPKDKFYSKLNESDISDEDYEHGKNVWDVFKCKTLGDYHNLYVESDVLLLADVFENFRTLCMVDDELDPAHYYTLPNYAWDAMMKRTGIKLDLLTDYDMHLMVEQGLRGGISLISHRHAVANNPYIKEYDPKKKHKYIIYLDANNLYGLAMVQSLPQSDFQWSSERDYKVLLDKYAENESEGCFVKCDLGYPEALHDLHNDYPLAPERKLVETKMLSPYAHAIKSKLNIGDDSCEKLVPNLLDKKDYVLDIRNLAYYVKAGLIVKNVKSVITFKQSKWLKPYIDFNTTKRANAKNDFEKDYYKLRNNAVFGKTMENLRGRVDMHFVTSYKSWGKKAVKKESTVERKIASPLYDGHVIYNDDLTAIKMKKSTIVLNKPIYAGMAILDLSKLHMYQFHYDVIKKKYGDKARLCMTDTDSLCYVIETDDIYKDMEAQKELYDRSNFDKDSPFFDESNKKVLGKFKDECDGKPPAEFVGLRPKMYSMLDGNSDKEKKTGKGIKRAYLKKQVGHADYRRCILSDKIEDQQQKAKFQCIRSKGHKISSYEINKVGLCCYDNKRYLLDDGITSLSYGHKSISGHGSITECIKDK